MVAAPWLRTLEPELVKVKLPAPVFVNVAVLVSRIWPEKLRSLAFWNVVLPAMVKPRSMDAAPPV